MPASQEKKKKKRASDVTIIQTRSFGGCDTCRGRHIKCDESRPACYMCTSSGLACGGYEKTIFFDFETGSDPGPVRFRRPLLTETEQGSMSRWLTSAIPSGSALSYLSQIDEECENTPATQDVEVSRGPFGAFRLHQSEGATDPQPLTEWTEVGNLDHFIMDDIGDYIPLPDNATSLLDENGTTLDDSSPELMPDRPELWDDVFNPGASPGLLTVTADADIDNGLIIPLVPLAQRYPSFISEHFDGPTSPDSIPPSLRVKARAPQDAVFLLQNYTTNVVGFMSPFRHTKTPWHVIFIPHVKNCLAALAMGEQLDHASLVTFYGTLAISAYSAGNVSQNQMWLDQASSYKQITREHCRIMLKTAYNIPKTAKYKVRLMALLTLVEVSIFLGNRDQVECYLLEAEKFIRLRGLHRKNKSRKVRLLHHCYAYERMFHESLFVNGTNTSHRNHVRESVESSGMVIYGQDSLSFRLPSWKNLTQELTEMKHFKDKVNDLHLERPGSFKDTMYPEIFGIPEPWLVLLSLIIRLGREKEASENPIGLKEYLNRAKAIEQCIQQLQLPSTVVNTSDGDTLKASSDTLNDMLQAIRHGFSLYFYRRIYDVEAGVLQDKVVMIRDCLLRCDAADPNMVYATAGFIWPAFLAASEAEKPELQASFAGWFKNCAQRSGLAPFTDALNAVKKIWESKRMGNEETKSWLDLLKRGILVTN